MHFLERPSTKQCQGQTIHMSTVFKEKVQSLQTERSKYVFKRDLYDGSDWSHLTSSGIEFQTEEESNENERSPSAALPCAGLLRRGMVYELERVLRGVRWLFMLHVSDNDGAELLWQW